MERALFNLRVKISDAEAVYNFICQKEHAVSYGEIIRMIAKNEPIFKCSKCFKKYAPYDAIQNNFMCPECGARVKETTISEVLAFLELLSFIKRVNEGHNPLFGLQKKIKLPFNLEILRSVTNLEESNDYNIDYKQALHVCLENDGNSFKTPQEFATFLNANLPGRTVLVNKNKAENWLLLFSDLGIISRLGSSYMIGLDPRLVLELLKIYDANTGFHNRIKLEPFLKFLKQFLPTEGTLPNTIMHALQILEKMGKIQLAAAQDDVSRKYMFDDGRYVREVIIK
jgi:DNA-directed RNA polymerase subunit RPC12/RpoP